MNFEGGAIMGLFLGFALGVGCALAVMSASTWAAIAKRWRSRCWQKSRSASYGLPPEQQLVAGASLSKADIQRGPWLHLPPLNPSTRRQLRFDRLQLPVQLVQLRQQLALLRFIC